MVDEKKHGHIRKTNKDACLSMGASFIGSRRRKTWGEGKSVDRGGTSRPMKVRRSSAKKARYS